jgi:hypothetical protein
MKPAAATRRLSEPLLQGIIQGALVWIWIHAVPTLIRPIFTWRGENPPTDAIEPLQQRGWVLVAIGTLLGLARIVLEYQASKRRISVPKSKLIIARTPKLSPTARLSIEACFIAFLLSGMLSSWLEAAILAGSIFVIRFYNRSMAQRLKAWDTLLSHLPLLIRFAAGIGVTYVLARFIVAGMWTRTDTFRPILISVILSLGVMTLLAPESRTRGASAPIRQ